MSESANLSNNNDDRRDHEGDPNPPAGSPPLNREPLPRPKRKRNRHKSDRGLPPDADLRRLAKEYLLFQRTHWPKLVELGLLPEPSPEVLDQMADDFKARHRTGRVIATGIKTLLELKLALGGSYARFSCDNSDALSNLDQTINGLKKAHADKHFVPWCYVFGDYSVSGLDASRIGYSHYKQTLASSEHHISTTYIDDFSRASREEIEWWKLASLSRRLKKRMLGASDNFDLHSPNWDLEVTLYGLFSRLFIKSLREKVRRGMKGANRRHTVLGKLPLGFTKRVAHDSDGNNILNADGTPKFEPCIDPVTWPWAVQMFELFVVKKWSRQKIKHHFNLHQVDGWTGWTPGAITNLLCNPAYIGVFIWNKTRREYDFEAEKWVKVKNPREEWSVFYDRTMTKELMDHWRQARRMVSAVRRKDPRTGRPLSKNQKSATTLFSGTLFCGYCENKELTLVHSCKDYKYLGCSRGHEHLHRCQLVSSKSIRTIERCLLAYICDHLLGKAELAKLVIDANRYLAEDAKKPRMDLAPLVSQRRKLESNIKKYQMLIEGSDSPELVKSYDKRVQELQKQLNQLVAEIRTKQAENQPTPPPLDLDRIQELVKNPRQLLNLSIPAAAEVIRAVTGPITVTQEPSRGPRRGARWFAQFRPNVLSLLADTAKKANSPVLVTLEYLKCRIWRMPDVACVTIDEAAAYKSAWPEIEALKAKGLSASVIAAHLGISTRLIGKAKKFAATGDQPKSNATTGSSRPQKPRSKLNYREISAEVAWLHDVEGKPFKWIAEYLDVSTVMVTKAYDFAHPELIREAVESGGAPRRANNSPLGKAKKDRIHEMIRNGARSRDIVAETGCSWNTVARERMRLRLK